MAKILFGSFIGAAIWVTAVCGFCLLASLADGRWIFGTMPTSLLAIVALMQACSDDSDIDDFEQSSPEEVRARLMALAASRRDDW